MFSPLRFQQICILGTLLALAPYANHQLIAADAQDEWRRIVEAAKKEGKVAGSTPTAVLRKQFKDTFESKFGLELELLGAWTAERQRAMAEFKAGVSYFDVLHGGSGTLEPLKNENMLAPFMDFMVLAEVKDPRQWWGGHMWEDNLKTNRFIYSFAADFSVPPFYNSDLSSPAKLTPTTISCSQNGKAKSACSNRAYQRRSRPLGILDEG